MIDSLRIEIEATGELNLSMVENAVPLVARISITNDGAVGLSDLEVEVELRPGFSSPWSAHVAAIPAGATFHLDEIDLPLDRARIVEQIERSAGELVVRIRRAGMAEPLATSSQPIAVLAYNEWSAATVPQLLAAFVLPNHPAVVELVRDARGPLERSTGNPALDGYQSGDAERVRAIARAIYETFSARGITYSNPPASFERVGQKIRLPEQVVGEQLATCLDITVMAAAAMECAGLHPLVVLLEGHAFPGVWLEDHYAPEAVIYEGSTMRKLVEAGRLVVFDSSAAVSRPPVPFAEAQRLARRALDAGQHVHTIDVTGARKQRFRPLPMRVAGRYGAAIEVPVMVPIDPDNQAGVSTSPGGQPTRPAARARHPRVEAWKHRLLDTSLRNRLLNYRDTKRCMELLFADLGAVEDALASGQELQIKSRPPLLGGDDPRSKKLLEARGTGDPVTVFLRERLGHRELYADQSSDAANARLTTIYRAAREVLEETGTNALCMTFGMLHWFESESSDLPRRAPILLVPVTLTRNARTSTFAVQASGEDARINVTLLEKLRADTGITVPELAELPLDDAGVDVAAVLQHVREAVLSVPRWEVKEELHLGLFSFAKFQMWADLEHNLDALLDCAVVRHLLDGKGEPFMPESVFPQPDQIDDKYAPQDLICPLDADASQLAAVAAGEEGKTFVLQGPPGTGKSQTIANLIAHCIARGKRVLFVAEKAVALEVVQRRLVQIGLSPYVLELHSHKAGKKQVLEQFREALEHPMVGEPASWERDTRQLSEARTRLNRYVEAMHRDRGGLTIFTALARLDELRALPLFELPASYATDKDQQEVVQQELARLCASLETIGPVSRSPWQGCRLPGWQFDLPDRVGSALDRALVEIEATRRAGTALAAEMRAGAPEQLGDIESLCTVAELLEAAPPAGDALLDGSGWATTVESADALTTLVRARHAVLPGLRERYQDGLFQLDLDDLAARFARYARRFFLIAWWRLRAARKTVLAVVRGERRPSRTRIAADLEDARQVRDAEARLEHEDASGRALFGPVWSGPASDPTRLEAAVEWARRYHQSRDAARPGLFAGPVERSASLTGLAAEARLHFAALREALVELAGLLGTDPRIESGNGESLAAVGRRLEEQRADLRHLKDWHSYSTAAAALTTAGCQVLVDAIVRGDLALDQGIPAFERGIYQAWLRETLAGEPALEGFDGGEHSRRVDAFAQLDRKVMTGCAAHAVARQSHRAPVETGTAPAGEMGVLQRELHKQRRHMPIRKLLSAIPSLAGRLKPCFMMSPMSVATYTDPGSMKFDVVVFDEASQIPTHDAVGALTRGRSTIVVGDSQQLPPTTFFEPTSDGDAADDDEFEEVDSILKECKAAGVPERYLDWHYRSRHESLIAFSNFHYYRNRLNTFPSALDRGAGRGVRLQPVVGHYDKGGARTNRAEADALVNDLVARLRSPGASARSHGVVTFSMAQQSLVEDLLDRARRDYPEIEPHFASDRPEPVIVKNLENIQGDERDVMLFSVCYGPDLQGRVSMNFGPLNRDGGERRLNVAVTRAREELVVYSTLAPDQIDLTRTSSVAVRHLKTFLDYARRGPVAIAEALTVESADRFDSPFEEQVCERLRGLGFQVDTQVGCAGYRIDMAIHDPDRAGCYLLGIECDGAHYHSARCARERDRLRAEVLTRLGWRIHRIWSTDWWESPERELEKVSAALERAQEHATRAADAPVSVAVAAGLSEMASTPRSSDPNSPTLPAVSMATAGTEPPPPDELRPITRAPRKPRTIVPYQVASVPAGRRGPEDVHDDLHRSELRRVLLEIVEIEAPLSLRVLARRVAPYFGIQRMSKRLEERLRDTLDDAAVVISDVVWRREQDPDTYAVARLAPDEARRDAPDVPIQEAANAAAIVLAANIALDLDELVRMTARELGFKRAGKHVAEQMAAAVRHLEETGRARREANKIVLV